MVGIRRSGGDRQPLRGAVTSRTTRHRTIAGSCVLRLTWPHVVRRYEDCETTASLNSAAAIGFELGLVAIRPTVYAGRNWHVSTERTKTAQRHAAGLTFVLMLPDQPPPKAADDGSSMCRSASYRPATTLRSILTCYLRLTASRRVTASTIGVHASIIPRAKWSGFEATITSPSR